MQSRSQNTEVTFSRSLLRLQRAAATLYRKQRLWCLLEGTWLVRSRATSMVGVLISMITPDRVPH